MSKIHAERDETILEINNKKTRGAEGMKRRLLFRGMTSSVGLSAVNQERSDGSMGEQSVWALSRRAPGFTNVFVILVSIRQIISPRRLNSPNYYRCQARHSPNLYSVFTMYMPPGLSLCHSAAQCIYRELPTLRGTLTTESLLPVKTLKAHEHGSICSMIKKKYFPLLLFL